MNIKPMQRKACTDISEFQVTVTSKCCVIARPVLQGKNAYTTANGMAGFVCIPSGGERFTMV